MLKKLVSLTQDMKEKDQYITAFLFTFVKKEYMVYVYRFSDKLVRVNPYARVLLKIIEVDNPTNILISEANVQGLLASAKEIREFLGLQYTTQIGDAIRAFIRALGQAMPARVGNNTDREKKIIAHTFSDDVEESEKIYCTRVRRNPEGYHRTEANAKKAELLVPEIYRQFQTDETISFCFSADPTLERTKNEIMLDFARRKGEEVEE